MTGSQSVSPIHRRPWFIALLAVAVVLVVAYIVFAARLSSLRALRATGPSWSFPSRVYSDGLAFREHRSLPVRYLLGHLEARGYREVRGPVAVPGTFSRRRDRFEIALRTPSTARVDARPGEPLPTVRLAIEDGRLLSVERLAADPAARRAGRVAGPVRVTDGLEPVPIALLTDDTRIWRVWTPIDRVPQGVRDAIVAAEDRRFERHIGVDLRAYLRALFANLRSGQVREGGSTITQQLARGLFLGRDRTLGRKLAEVPLALGLEIALSKPQILEMYLNAIYWGQAGGFSLGGIEAASRWYFDAPVESLSVLDGATLAAIIPAPNLYDPFRRPAVVRKRRDQVLRAMVESKRLAASRAAELAREPLRVRRGVQPSEPHPWYSGFVTDQLEAMVPRRRIAHEGLIVLTHLDLVWQGQAEQGLAESVESLDQGGAPRVNGRRPPLEGAFVALEPGTGGVRALVGGRSSRVGAFNRAYQARRQPGSAIKPVVYAAALATGRYTPATTISDMPRTFQTDRGPWRPQNDDGTYHTEVTLVKALEKSLNVATTHLVDAIGADHVARVCARFGLGELKPVKSIGLGSNESTLLDLTRAFAVFGDGGTLRPARAIRTIIDHSGRQVEATVGNSLQGRGSGAVGLIRESRAISEPIAALMTALLTDVVRFGVAYPLRSVYNFTRPVGGKTGTTDGYKDAWFVGFTPDVVAGVWIGYDRPSSLGRLAADTALPAWAGVVGRMLEGFPPTPFASDARIEWRDVNPWSGRLAAHGCPTQPVPFLPGTAPRKYCEPPALEGPEYEPEGSSGDSAAVAEPEP